MFDDLYSGLIVRGDDSLLEALQVGALAQELEIGSVFYDIPSIGRTGMIPIQRINSENVAQCHGQQAGKR